MLALYCDLNAERLMIPEIAVAMFMFTVWQTSLHSSIVALDNRLRTFQTACHILQEELLPVLLALISSRAVQVFKLLPT